MYVLYSIAYFLNCLKLVFKTNASDPYYPRRFCSWNPRGCLNPRKFKSVDSGAFCCAVQSTPAPTLAMECEAQLKLLLASFLLLEARSGLLPCPALLRLPFEGQSVSVGHPCKPGALPSAAFLPALPPSLSAGLDSAAAPGSHPKSSHRQGCEEQADAYGQPSLPRVVMSLSGCPTLMDGWAVQSHKCHITQPLLARAAFVASCSFLCCDSPAKPLALGHFLVSPVVAMDWSP